MIGSKTVACVIPARLKSTRFPKKMLSILKGKPLLQWVWESARQIPFFDTVAFAIDAEETAQLIASFQGTYFMTSEACQVGTERLIEVMQRKLIDADIWVNWQGDEPFLDEKTLHSLLHSSAEDGSDVWTLKKKISKPEEVQSPHIPKIVCDSQDFALYFSRSVIPYYRDIAPGERKIFFKHVGLYAFTREALQKISTLPACEIELAEQLEQLRWLYHGLRIRVHETQQEVFGIDLPEHLALAEAFLDNKSKFPS